MSRTARYTPLAPSREDEMEAAFESDDEGHDDTADEAARRPMLAHSQSQNQNQGPAQGSHTRSSPPTVTTAGGYNFEQVYDYDFPPPGSPPRPTSTALPDNGIGNSNGLLPTEPVWRPAANGSFLQRGFRRLFPARYSRLATNDGAAVPIGGGSANDGVFANVTAKPTSARVERTPDGVYVMPEESQKDTPPSYAAAQADAVPPYWETTVHAPSASIAGEMIVDNLPTGTLFSFLWNMLISLSFNFVGFLLTYLLHTTHAAKYGSRAGLGITLLQYGFALRNRESDPMGGTGGGQDQWPWEVSEPAGPTSSEGTPTPVPLPATTANATATAPSLNDDMQVAMPYPQEWIAFFLMTVGWFLVLTSFLGYWRVKRWEYQILQAAQQNQARTTEVPSAEAIARDRAVRRNLEQLFGFSMRRAAEREQRERQEREERERDLEAGHPEVEEDEESLTPEERRLRADLRAAGLI